MDRVRNGVLVIRVWRDRGEDAPLKGRLTSVLDLASRERTELTCAGADEVRAAVSRWLTEFEVASLADEDEGPLHRRA